MALINRERIRQWGPTAIGVLLVYGVGVFMDGKWADLGPPFSGLQVISDVVTTINVTLIVFVGLVLVVIYLYSY